MGGVGTWETSLEFDCILSCRAVEVFGAVCVITAAICSLLFTVQYWWSLLFLMFTNGIIVTVCIAIVCQQVFLLVIFGVFL